MIKTANIWLPELQSSTGKWMMRKRWENLNKKQHSKNVNNYECLLKRMLYCPGNGEELS